VLGIQRAYLFVAVGYVLAAVSVALTFPAGSARDRAQAGVTEVATVRRG
jgi:hypothetical protein